MRGRPCVVGERPRAVAPASGLALRTLDAAGWSGACLRSHRPPRAPPRFPRCRRFTEGIYVLYTYTAAPTAGQAVQKYLSTPQAGAELNILRHMTFRV